jgi:hypothetical protein
MSGLLFWLGCGGAVRSGDTATVDAGSGGTGGTGGSVGAGGSSGTAGSAGTAGTGGLPALCQLPPDPGPCEAAIRAYWHNPGTGVCEAFVYGGCQGNANRFETLSACQAACHGGTPDYDACTRPTDCSLASVACCGGCEPVTAEALVALNRNHLADYNTFKGCDGLSCGACADVSPMDRTSQYFVATCASGQCTVVDIRETDLVACKDYTECTLRVGAECCERCSSDSVVALSTNAKLGDLVCGSDAPSCPPCVPTIPPGFAASCNTGKCTVTAGVPTP